MKPTNQKLDHASAWAEVAGAEKEPTRGTRSPGGMRLQMDDCRAWATTEVKHLRLPFCRPGVMISDKVVFTLDGESWKLWAICGRCTIRSSRVYKFL